MTKTSRKSRTRRRSNCLLWLLLDKELILQLEAWNRIRELGTIAVSILHKVTANKTNHPNSKLIKKARIWWGSRVGLINSKRLTRLTQCRSLKSSHQDPKNTKSKVARSIPMETVTQPCQDQWMAPTKTLDSQMVTVFQTQKLQVATLIRSFVLTRMLIKIKTVNNIHKVLLNLLCNLRFKIKFKCKIMEPLILLIVDNCLTN